MGKNFEKFDSNFDLDEILREEKQKKKLRKEQSFLEDFDLSKDITKNKKNLDYDIDLKQDFKNFFDDDDNNKKIIEKQNDFINKSSEKHEKFDVKIDFDKENLLIDEALIDKQSENSDDLDNQDILKNLFGVKNKIGYVDKYNFKTPEPSYQQEETYLRQSEVFEILKKNRKFLFKKFLLVLFCFIISLFSIVSSLSYDLTFENINIWAIVNLFALTTSIVVCNDFIINSFKTIFIKKTSKNLFVSLIAIFVTIQSTLAIFDSKAIKLSNIYSPSIILILLFSILSKYQLHKIMKNNSRYLSVCEDTDEVRFTNIENLLDPQEYNIACFSQKSDSKSKPKLCFSNFDILKQGKKLYIYMILLFCLGFSLVSFFINNNLYFVLNSLCCMLIISYPLSDDFCFGRSVYRESKKLFKNKILLYKYSAIKKIKNCKSLIIDNDMFFDQTSFKLVKIKIFDYNKINDSIIDISSLLYQSKSLLSGLFLNIINNKLTLLKKSKILKKENNGIIGNIDENKIIFGTSDYLLDNNIVIPSKYVRLSDSLAADKTLKALYVAHNGVLTAMFLIKVIKLEKIKEFLEQLKKSDVKITLCLKDMFISSEDLACIYDIDKDSMLEISDKDKNNISSKKLGILHSEGLSSFIVAITRCIKINKKFDILSVLEIVNFILTSCLIVTFIVLGAINYITFSGLVLIQLFWLIISIIISSII